MRPVCGVAMARGDVCVRTTGHGYAHRSAYAMANDRDRSRDQRQSGYRLAVPYADPKPMSVCPECGHLR